MADLYLSLGLMILLCLAAGIAGARIALRSNPRSQLLFQLLAGLLMAVYMVFLWDRPVLTRWLPWSAALVLGNWLPVLACFFVGNCSGNCQIPRIRRSVLTFVTYGLSLYSLYSPVTGDPPLCISQQNTKTLLIQTSEETCSPASAASLLRIHGIHASEGEMARLCLTRGGTHWLGVFRGLKLKVAGTGWDVVAEEFELTRDFQKARLTPGVLSIAFSARSGSPLVASGFSTQQGHSVVLLGNTASGELRVFDPSPEFGFETWNREFLKQVESAVLFRLVPKTPLVLQQSEVPSVTAESNGVHIYKICSAAEWRDALKNGVYSGSQADREDGFIHFSAIHQVHETARKHFSGKPDLVLIKVLARDLGNALRWEPSRGGDLFPHLYGTFPTEKAVSVFPVVTRPDGEVVIPCDSPELQ